MELDLREAVEAFKVAWEAADKAGGQAGHRTEAGMAIAAPIIAAQVLEILADELRSAFPITVRGDKALAQAIYEIDNFSDGDD